MRRLDTQLPWGREPEAGEDVVNDRRQRIERENLLFRIAHARPQIQIRPRTPLPHLLPQNNYKKQQMQADYDAEVRRNEEKKAHNIRLRQERADKEARDRPKGLLLRPTLTSFALNKQRFEHRVEQENRKLRKALREARGTLPTKKWAADAAKNEQYRVNCSRYAKRFRQAAKQQQQRSGGGGGGGGAGRRRRQQQQQQQQQQSEYHTGLPQLPPISPLQF